jgi:DNA polymerase-3 subunit gamma/tau
MSYQVLARKWRPRTFKEMAGQGHVLKTLINALDSQRLHHAYLFTGTRGVGKTTIARIFARCLNCETGITSTPCGECSACREISEGRFLDLIEVDAASRTKVEDTRELLENVQYAPSRGRFKVYLIDEVHMLSTHSFNALLKTLEEPPPHVKFLLATTDPQKLPVTVLSRCLQFNLKNLSAERLVEHIRHILDEEKITYEDAALWQLGRAAQGSVRDCLTLLDQAIGFCQGKLTDSGVREFLGNIDRSVIIQLMDALVAEDAAAVLKQVADVAEYSPDFAVILQEMLSWLHRVAIAQVVPDGIDNSQGDREQVLAHAAALPAETVQLYYQVALKGREDLPFVPDARSALEMTLLRMLAFTPAGIPKVPQATLAGQKAGPAQVDTDPAVAGQKKKPLAEAAAPRSVAPAPASGRPVPPNDEAPEASLPKAAQQKPVSPQAPEPPLTVAPAPPAGTSQAGSEQTVASSEVRDEAPGSTDADLVAEAAKIGLADLRPGMWIELFGQLPLAGVARSIAANCILQDISGNRLTLLLEENKATLFNDEHRKRIEAVFAAYFTLPVSLLVEIGPVAAETPAAFRQRCEAERREAAIEAFTGDAVVQAVVERFGGEIQYESIVPRTPANGSTV